MIDPKFNEIDDIKTGKRTAETGLSEADTSTATSPRQGLSINDTIAGDANLSVGSRGTDTSGVRAGAGAGAGSSFVTPGNTGSPAPNVVPGARGSGMTPMSTTNPGQGSTSNEESYAGKAEPTAASSREYGDANDSYSLTDDEISAHAYNCWVERGCPHGSAEEDWHRAERELRERAQRPRVASASA